MKQPLVLTFDDGPRSESTDAILRTLDDRSLRAAFFVNGTGNGANVGKIHAILGAGHVVGNHTWGHKNTPSEGPDSFKSLHNHLLDGHNYKMKYWRAPGGRKEALEPTARELGYLPHTGWNFDSLDWKFKSADAKQMFETVLANANPSSYGPAKVALFHDRADVSTYRVLPDVIELLEQRFDLVDFNHGFADGQRAHTGGETTSRTWAIMLGSFILRGHATDAVNKATLSGLTATNNALIREAQVGGRLYHRVFLAPKPSSAQPDPEALLVKVRRVFPDATLVRDSKMWK